MTTLTPVVVEETIQATGGDFATVNLWEAALPQVLTREVDGQTCSATAADNAHIVLHAGADAADDYYTGLVVETNGEQRRITGYVGATKTAAVGPLNGGAATFTATPQINDAFTIYPVIRKGLMAAETFTERSSIAGQTTDADAYVWLTTQAGASWRDGGDQQIDQKSGVAEIAHASAIADRIVLTVDTPFTIVQGLQIRATGVERRITQLRQLEATSVVRDCIVFSAPAATSQLRDMADWHGLYVNCVFFCESANNAVVFEPFSNTMRLVNCTTVRPTALGNLSAIVSRIGSFEARSCAFYGDVTNFQTGSTGTIVVDHCATNLSTFGTLTSGASNIVSGSATPTSSRRRITVRVPSTSSADRATPRRRQSGLTSW